MTGEDHGFQVQSNGIYSGYIESHVFLAKARLIQCRRGEKKSLLWIKNIHFALVRLKMELG